MTIDINKLRRLAQAATPGPWVVNASAISELLDRLEAAESDGLEQAHLNGMGGEREAALLSKLEAAEKERDDLRAKIAEMQNQEPVVEVQWAANIPNSFLDFISTDGYLPKLGDKLYTLPGAQGENK